MKLLLWWVGIVSVLLTDYSTLSKNVDGFADSNDSLLYVESNNVSMAGAPLLINQTIITNATAKGAVCLDGSPPVYHFHAGFGSGKNNWVIDLEGGGWCNNLRTCVFRKTTQHGSSKYMEKQLPFVGLLSNKPEENPDFYNWNRVRVRYCDGASFLGDSENMTRDLQFRGQRIWSAAMEELMSKGMRNAQQALLSGCSAGGLATIFHCDEFRSLFPRTTKVKCLSDGGLFLDVVDVSGGHSITKFFSGVVETHGLHGPRTCHLDPTSCFFPQNLIHSVTTPLFILNSAYDAFQIRVSLAPNSADPKGEWTDCKKNHLKCSASQIQYLQVLRNQMVEAVHKFSLSKQNGLFINSCFSHCQTILTETWFAKGSPAIGNKAIAIAVGDWYFDRATVDDIGRPYPVDKTCHDLF